MHRPPAAITQMSAQAHPIVIEQLRILRYLAATESQLTSAQPTASSNDSTYATAQTRLQQLKQLDAAWQQHAVGDHSSQCSAVDVDQEATISELNSKLNATLLANAVCLARMQPAVHNGASDLDDAAQSAVPEYLAAALALQHAVEHYYSEHLYIDAAQQGLTATQHKAMQREVQRLSCATAIARQQHIAAQAYLANMHARVQHLQRALSGALASPSTDTAHTTTPDEAKLMHKITQQCCQMAAMQAGHVLRVDTALKASRMRYAQHHKRAVASVLAQQGAQLAVLHAMLRARREAATTLQLVAGVAMQCAEDLHSGAAARIAIAKRRPLPKPCRGLGLEAMLGDLLAALCGAEARMLEPRSQCVRLQRLLTGAATVPGGMPLALPPPLPQALQALAGDTTSLADAVEALLATLAKHQQAIAGSTAVGLQRKVLKHFFTNPRKLASLARAAGRG